MRHIRSFMLSLVLAPLIWALTGLGLAVHEGIGPDLEAELARQLALGALAAAGALAALLVVPRLSPIGPTLAGLGFLGAVAYAPSLRPLVPALPNGLDVALLRPADGFAVVLGIPLLTTAFSGYRWRRPERHPLRYAERNTPVVISPAPAAGTPAQTLVSPAPTLVSPPVPPAGSKTGSTYGSSPAAPNGHPPTPTYGSQPAPTLVAPTDPWHGWTAPDALDGSPAPGHAAPDAVNPWARPSGSSPDDATDDLSAALLPLRSGTPRRIR